MLAAQRSSRLWAAIHTLPLIHRAVLVLALEDMTHPEIAEVLGVSTNNVAVRLTRARDALKRILGGSNADAG